MINIEIHKSTPIGSLIEREQKEETYYLQQLQHLPESIVSLLMASKTGAYLRGLLKNKGMPLEGSSKIAFMIFRLAVGEITLSQLPAHLSGELKIANDKAQLIAKEIERDLIAPVAADLNHYITEKKRVKGSISSKIRQQPAKTAIPHPSLLQPKNTKPQTNPANIQPKRVPNKPAIPPNILDLKKKWEQPKPPPIPH